MYNVSNDILYLTNIILIVFKFRMKQERVVLSTDGPDHNVVKLKPPMCFTVVNADEVLQKLDVILTEITSAAASEEALHGKPSEDSLVDDSATAAKRRIISLA